MNSDPEFELDQADAALWKKTRSGETGRRHVCSGVAGNPPEDCGGIGGYYRLLEIMADQKLFIPADKGLTAGIPAIYAHLQSQGWQVEREHLMVRGFPVQFLAASGLTEEAVREAEHLQFEGIPARIFRAEHIVAIAASVGRQKDKARIEQLLQQADLDKTYLENLLQRHQLKLPTL